MTKLIKELHQAITDVKTDSEVKHLVNVFRTIDAGEGFPIYNQYGINIKVVNSTLQHILSGQNYDILQERANILSFYKDQDGKTSFSSDWRTRISSIVRNLTSKNGVEDTVYNLRPKVAFHEMTPEEEATYVHTHMTNMTFKVEKLSFEDRINVAVKMKSSWVIDEIKHDPETLEMVKEHIQNPHMHSKNKIVVDKAVELVRLLNNLGIGHIGIRTSVTFRAISAGQALIEELAFYHYLASFVANQVHSHFTETEKMYLHNGAEVSNAYAAKAILLSAAYFFPNIYLNTEDEIDTSIIEMMLKLHPEENKYDLKYRLQPSSKSDSVEPFLVKDAPMKDASILLEGKKHY